jgi:hypothetical protein
MAIATNTSLTFSSVQIREQLSDVIYNIAPLDTPFLSGCAKEKIENTYFQWQTDTITAGAANRKIEGDDSIAATARVLPTLVGNYTQISQYIAQTSGTDDAVNYAGHGKHQAYQLAKHGKRMKRDMEYMLTYNTARVAGDSTTARATAGLPSWLGTNYQSVGSGGAPAASSGNGTDAMGDASSTGSITEAGIKATIKDCYEAGGNPDLILCKPTIKQAISDLTQSVSELRTQTKGDVPAHVVAAVDVYVSDFGTFKIQADRNAWRDRDVFFLDMDYWAIAWLRPFQTVELAKTGDATKQMLLAEYGLVSKNEKSSGILADCAA